MLSEINIVNINIYFRIFALDILEFILECYIFNMQSNFSFVLDVTEYQLNSVAEF